MATLSDAQKVFVVQRLACFRTPSEIVELVKDEFGLEITRQQVNYYDPNKAQGSAQLADRWKELFRETRREYRKREDDVAIANKVYRLERLDRMAREAEHMKNYPLAADLGEKAAKEMGGAYTNERKYEHDVRAQLGFTADERAQAEEELDDWTPEDDE